MSGHRPHRAGDPRGHRQYRTWRDGMRAKVASVCVLCRGLIGDVPWPDPGSWTWHHDPSMEWIMRSYPREEWLSAACNPNGGGPAHQLCNGRAGTPWPNGGADVSARSLGPVVPRPQCADCADERHHLHRDRLGAGLAESMDGYGRSENW